LRSVSHTGARGRALPERMRALGKDRARGRCGLARGERGAGNVVGGSRECALQVVLGIRMEARKLRAGQTENGFHLRYGRATQEQFLGDPQVRDTPIGMSAALETLETVQPGLIDCGGLARRDVWDGAGTGWSRVRRDMRMWRRKETGHWSGARHSMRCGLQQGAAVGGETHSGMPEHHPGRPSGGQSPLKLWIGEPRQSSQMAPVCANPVSLALKRR
jgi:hypothetical protein